MSLVRSASDFLKSSTEFYIEHLSRRNVSSTTDLHVVGRPASTFLPLALLLIGIVTWRSYRNEDAPQQDVKGLQALVSVLTPPGSLWPKTYTTLVGRAHHDIIELPLRGTIGDILAGIVQLRNPREDLVALVRDGTHVGGWRICFLAEKSWWIEVTSWLSLTQMASLRYTLATPYEISFASLAGQLSASTLCTPEQIQSALSNPTTTRLLTSYHLVSNQPSTLCLDFLPHAHLEPFIRHMQSTLRPGVPVTLEFSTLGSTVPLFSTQFILCALIFLPRKYSNQSQRTSFSLLASLHRVIELSSTSCPTSASLTIKSLENVSEKYAGVLDSAVNELVEAREIREQYIRQFGMQAWREQKFWTEWEAATVRAGHLERWVLIVQK